MAASSPINPAGSFILEHFIGALVRRILTFRLGRMFADLTALVFVGASASLREK
jgi:hypothetical protein